MVEEVFRGGIVDGIDVKLKWAQETVRRLNERLVNEKSAIRGL